VTSRQLRCASCAPIAAIALAIGLVAGGVRAVGARDPAILMVTSYDTEPYRLVMEGFQGYLVKHGMTGPMLSYSLQSREVEARHALELARRSGASPLLTIGSVATQAALQAEGEGPVIACMIVDEKVVRNAINATGVSLDFSLETQFEWMKKFLPEGQTVGVLYNPSENQDQIAAAERVARGFGLRLAAREVERPQALPAALASLTDEADLLWGVTDQMVLSPQTAEAILLFSFRNRIPFTGLSESWVRAGALYALDRDYADIGAQCGELALKVLRGAKAGTLPPQRPRKLTYAVNLRTAEHLKVEIPTALIHGAQRVFR
jgi:putative ABC transport system substrate-binding protein